MYAGIFMPGNCAFIFSPQRCLLLLLNILAIAALSMPTPLRQFMNEPANTIIGEFSFIYLPGVLVVIAYSLHIFSLRQLHELKSTKGWHELARITRINPKDFTNFKTKNGVHELHEFFPGFVCPSSPQNHWPVFSSPASAIVLTGSIAYNNAGWYKCRLLQKTR